MYTLKPYFYDDFRCIGGECPYTCCGGWCITVDKEAYEKYVQYGGSLKKKIMESFVVYDKGENIYRIQLNEKGMCPLCGSDYLCMLAKEKGEEVLGSTCRDFPRQKFMTREIKEYYMSLGCPAAVRFLKGRQEPLSFILEEGGHEERDELGNLSEKERKGIEALYRSIEMDMDIRNRMVDLLQNREWPLWFREFLVAYCLDAVKEEHNQEKAEAVYAILERILDPYFMSSLRIKLESVQNDEEKQFMLLRRMAMEFQGVIEGMLFIGNHGEIAKKIMELLNRNVNISFEEYKAAYSRWRQYEERNFDILMEHIISYNWMEFAMIAFTKYYMVDNYWDMMLGQILIKYFCIMHYSIYDSADWTDIEFIISLICRSLNHGRDMMKEKVSSLKKKSWLSVANLFLLVRP